MFTLYVPLFQFLLVQLKGFALSETIKNIKLISIPSGSIKRYSYCVISDHLAYFNSFWFN